MAKEKNPVNVKRGRSSKRKGAAGEREAAKEFQDKFPGLEAHRGRQYHGGPGTPDVMLSIDNVHLEVKRTETFNLYKALNQAREDADGKVPVVLHRRSREKWVVCVELDRLPEFVRIMAPLTKEPELIQKLEDISK